MLNTGEEARTDNEELEYRTARRICRENHFRLCGSTSEQTLHSLHGNYDPRTENVF